MDFVKARVRRLRKELDLARGSRDLVRQLGDTGPDTFLGVYDFSYAPYALGDATTFQAKVMCGAIDGGYSRVRICLVTDPMRPACALQPHITNGNYADFINRLYPTYLCTPLAGSVHVFRSRYSFNAFLMTAQARGVGSWPSYADHYDHNLDFISHNEINRFFADHGYLPRLTSPSGYEDSVDDFIDRVVGDRFLVTVNIRLSRMSNRPADIHRDSPVEPWHAFFRHAQRHHPEVVFALVGGFGEWDRTMPTHPNVVIMRMHGYQLAEELTLLHRSGLFFGSSSGFAAVATFSKVPYIITNMEHRFSGFNGVPVGEPRYPFGLANQRISWEMESTDLLIDLFEETYQAIRDGRDAVAVPAADTPLAKGTRA